MTGIIELIDVADIDLEGFFEEDLDEDIEKDLDKDILWLGFRVCDLGL